MTERCRAAGVGTPQSVPVPAVTLPGVRVTARAILKQAEHDRRARAALEAVTDPALLGRLLELPGRARPPGNADAYGRLRRARRGDRR
jgi:hypothetical protein